MSPASARTELGAPTGETPATSEQDDVAQLLEQLQQRCACTICNDPIAAFDMFVVWPIGGVVAHMACYVSGQALPRVEASS